MNDNTAGFLAKSLNLIEEPLLVLGADRSCLFANEAFCSLVRVEEAESIDIASVWPGSQTIDFAEGEVAIEFVLADGEASFVRMSVSEIGESGYLLRVVEGSSKENVTNSFHAQRLTTLGMLAGGVAHDFNNVLAGILGHITYLKTVLPGSGSHVESLSAIEEGAKKASTMTQQILDFSKLGTEEKLVPIDVGSLIQRTCMLLRGAISPEFYLKQEVPEERIEVLAVEGKVAQVIANLIINARDALSSGGTIEIGLSRIECPERGALAELRVSDDGEGMPTEVMSRVFEPYFTTKNTNGTGLGLSTVQAIVRDLGGRIEVESEQGVGTTFRVSIPLCGRTPRRKVDSSKSESDQLAKGTESILIVDDEDPVRNVLSVSLVHLGYTIDVACSGAEAIEKFQADSEKYDLIILDMLMPNLPGQEVFFRMKEINPALRVLVISGFSSEEAVQSILDGGGLDFIQKPFTIEDLSRKVRDCLDAE